MKSRDVIRETANQYHKDLIDAEVTECKGLSAFFRTEAEKQKDTFQEMLDLRRILRKKKK